MAFSEKGSMSVLFYFPRLTPNNPRHARARQERTLAPGPVGPAGFCQISPVEEVRGRPSRSGCHGPVTACWVTVPQVHFKAADAKRQEHRD